MNYLKKSLLQSSIIITFSVMITGCATWNTSEIANVRPATQKIAVTETKDIILTEGDITDKKYIVLGDISVTVNKTTIFHPDPTKELVNVKLKEEAAKLGADAVTQIRYGTVGISMMSWGSLDGKGRAIQFSH
jgi:hypothetical protein